MLPFRINFPFELNILLQVRVSDLVEKSNGNSSRPIARKQSLSLSKRPEVIVVKKPAGNLNTLEVEDDQPGYDLEDRESGDGSKYCLLEAADDDNGGASSTTKEMIDQSA
jgi:hypothetical protein